MQPPRFEIAPCPPEAVARLRRELGVSRRARAGARAPRPRRRPSGARAFLAADEQHDHALFAGIDVAVASRSSRTCATRRRITIHGDYDVDGVCSTAILVRALRALGADVDSYLPDRAGDGYGLGGPTVRRLAARGTRLLVTADCAITAVEEVGAGARAGHAGGRHRPSLAARRRAPAATRRSCIRRSAATRAPSCARRPSRYKLAQALVRGAPGATPAELDAGPRPGGAGDDRRRGPADRREPRARAPRPARAGGHAQAGPARADGRGARRSRPRRRALGRLRAGAAHQRRGAHVSRRRRPGADAHRGPRARGADRLASSIAPTPSAARSRRASAGRPKRRSPSWASAAAYVLAGEGWHAGVIGIVAARLVETPQPPGRADRARRRPGEGLGTQHRRVRPARRR